MNFADRLLRNGPTLTQEQIDAVHAARIKAHGTKYRIYNMSIGAPMPFSENETFETLESWLSLYGSKLAVQYKSDPREVWRTVAANY